ncbi:hypothetical protein [Antarcticibacterium sp. 1MA-6-2]|nr:hypothetical protein [Antarcticibacterium sp. 1MA-6-2]
MALRYVVLDMVLQELGFAVGIAYTSVWYEKDWQGRALGIFGAGNA